MPKAKVPTSEISIVARGDYYVAIAVLMGKPLDSEFAIELATINIKMVGDREHYEKWREFVIERYKLAVATCFGEDPDELTLIRTQTEARN